MRLCVYTRRSTERQAASPHTQEALCREYALANGHGVTRVLHEVAISGKTEIERRTALPELLSMVANRKTRDFDGVIVWRTDRLCRNPAEWHRILSILDRHKCALISVKDPVKRETAHDRFASNIMADVAALERELTGERIYAHHIAEFMKGRWAGGPVPLGLTWLRESKAFEPSDRAADVVTVFETFIAQNGNASATAGALNHAGLPSPTGGLWSNVTILGLLRNPMYRRRLSYDGRQIDAPEVLPDIVAPELCRQADTLLDYGKKLAPRQVGSKRPYSGLIHCSECGGVMILSVGTHNGNGGRDRGCWYPNWVCRNRKQARVCSGKYVSHLMVESLVGRLVQMLFNQLRADLLGLATDETARRTAAKTEGQAAVKRLVNLRAQRDRLVKLYVLGKLDEAAALREIDEIDRQIQVHTQTIPQTAPAVDRAAVVAALEALAQEWETVPDAEKRALMLNIGAEFVLSTDPENGQTRWMQMSCSLLDEPLRAEGEYRGSRWGLVFRDPHHP